MDECLQSSVFVPLCSVVTALARDLLSREPCQLFKSWVSNVFILKGHTRSWALFRGPHVEKHHHVSNRLNDCAIFIVHMKVTNMATGHTVQSGRPRVKHAGFKEFYISVSILNE